jgi:hypothetical protein
MGIGFFCLEFGLNMWMWIDEWPSLVRSGIMIMCNSVVRAMSMIVP